MDNEEQFMELVKSKERWRIWLQTCEVWQRKRIIGTAFLNCVKRGVRTLRLNIQLKDPLDKYRVVEEFMVKIPLDGLKFLLEDIEKTGKININSDHKWEIKWTKIK